MYIFDIYTNKKKKWLSDYSVKTIQGPLGDYYRIRVPESDLKKIKRRLFFTKYRCYDEKWNRSATYRKKFFEQNPGPWRCRYCHRALHNHKEVCIDHIVPISKAKRHVGTRNLLYIQGISDVNDVRNLAPSCYTCNTRKGMKTGIWFVRGILGKYTWYWILRYALKIVVILLLVGIFIFFWQENRILLI